MFNVNDSIILYTIQYHTIIIEICDRRNTQMIATFDKKKRNN